MPALTPQEHRMLPPATAPQPAAATPQGGCRAATKAGTPCRGYVGPGRDYCLMHDPDRREAAQAARTKGGATGNRLRALKGKRPDLTNVPALIAFTGGVIADTLD